MNVAIFGCKYEGEYLFQELKKDDRIQVRYFVDNDSRLEGKRIDSCKIISVNELKKVYGREVDRVIIAMRGIRSRSHVCNQLRREKVDAVGMLKLSAVDYRKRIVFDEVFCSEGVFWLKDIEKPVIPYLEMHVVDGCNLKCSGCAHFSNLFGEEVKIELEEFERDIKRISSIAMVPHLRLLGGEPLLNADLVRYIECARSHMPETDICVVTNGILIPRESQDLFRCMKEQNVGFSISQYLPTVAIKDKIINVLEKNEVDYVFSEDIIKQFYKSLCLEKIGDGKIAHQVCRSGGCRFLRQGKLYKCPFEGLINQYYTYYDLPQRIEGGIDLYKENVDWQKTLEELCYNPVQMCAFCGEKAEWFDWQVSAVPKKEEWLLEHD